MLLGDPPVNHCTASRQAFTWPQALPALQAAPMEQRQLQVFEIMYHLWLSKGAIGIKSGLGG